MKHEPITETEHWMSLA